MDCGNPTRIYNTIDFSTPKNDVHQSFFAVVFLLFLCSLLFVPVSADAATLSKPPNNLGLVGYWSFNEGSGNVATDFSGNGNHGSLENGPQWVNGKLGKALEFDGNGDHSSLTSSSIIPTSGDFTIAFWVNADTTPNGQERVAIGTGTAAGQRNYIYTTTTLGSANNQLKVSFGDSEILMGNDIRGAGWKHVVITRSGNSWILYEDGDVVDTETSAVTLASYSEFRIGGGTDADARWHSGGIDEVRIYNRALSATEIAALYSTGVARLVSSSQLTAGSSLEKGLVGHWTLDGRDVNWTSPTAGTALDSSGQGNNGTLINMNQRTSPAIGKLGQAFEFVRTNGSGIRVSSSNGSNLDFTGPFSVSAWVNIPELPPENSSYAIFAKDTFGGWSFQHYGFDHFYDNIGRLRFCIDHSVTGIACRMGGSLPLNEWVHVAGVWDGTTLSVCKSGEQAGASVLGEGGVQSRNINAPVGIGYDAQGDRHHLNGRLDDVRAYSRALSADEVRKLANLGQATANAPSQTLQLGTTLADGLVGHWTFDGRDVTATQAFDVSGNENAGTISGATPAIGKLGQALAFDGSNDHVRRTTSSSDALDIRGPLTLAAWVKPNSIGSFDYIISKNSNGGYEDQQFALAAEAGRLVVAIGGDSERIDNHSWVLGQWVFVAATWDGTTARVYVDGYEISDHSYTPTFSHKPNFSIGRRFNSGDGSSSTLLWDGIIDDVRIYDRALTEAEIKQLFRIGR